MLWARQNEKLCIVSICGSLYIGCHFQPFLNILVMVINKNLMFMIIIETVLNLIL